METSGWYSIDPLTCVLVPYPPDVDVAIEAAYVANQTDAHLPDFMQMCVGFEKMVQRTPEMPGRRGKRAGVRSVVRAIPGSIVHLQRTNDRWHAASTGDPHTVPPRMGEGSWTWEWCEQVALFHARETSWHEYADDVVKALEEKWTQGGTFEHTITVGLRNFKIVVDRNEAFYRQVDDKYTKGRWVRRGFRPSACEPSSGAILPSIEADDLCALCCESFAATPHWPTTKLYCGHIFHAACVQPVKDSTRRCPMCRSDIS
jgi:hypothetical protein